MVLSANINITISKAVEADVVEMVAIYCDAMEDDIVTRFMYGQRREEAVKIQTRSFTPALYKWFTNPPVRCKVIKAMQRDKIVGWALIRSESGKRQLLQPMPIPGEPEFLGYYWRQQKKNWNKLTNGQKHVVLGSLYVQPGYQRLGIGTALVTYLFKHYSLQTELIFVQTVASSEEFYSKLGWRTVGSTDIDLSDWGGKNRGYGLHKSLQMLRQPGPLSLDTSRETQNV